MSQAKVDQYKKEKANRRETVAKEKRNRKIIKFFSGLCVGLVAVWIAFSVVEVVKENRPVETVYCNIEDLDAYLNELYNAEK